MAVIKANVNGSPNVGLFGCVVQDTLLFGEKIKNKEEFEKTLGLTFVRCKIAGTDLPGVMCVGNSNTLLVPHILFENEEATLNKHKINFTKITTNTTCLGNTIVCNDTGAILSTEFSEEEVEQIAAALKVPCVQHDIAELTTPGAVVVVRGKHAIVHKDASDADVKIIEKTLGVTVAPATVNLGSPHLRAGILFSDNGMIIGDHSGGPEIVNIDESLGYNQVQE